MTKNLSFGLRLPKKLLVTLNLSKKLTKNLSLSLNRPLGYSKNLDFPSVFVGFFNFHDFAQVAAQIDDFLSPGSLLARFSSLGVSC